MPRELTDEERETHEVAGGGAAHLQISVFPVPSSAQLGPGGPGKTASTHMLAERDGVDPVDQPAAAVTVRLRRRRRQRKIAIPYQARAALAP